MWCVMHLSKGREKYYFSWDVFAACLYARAGILRIRFQAATYSNHVCILSIYLI